MTRPPLAVVPGPATPEEAPPPSGYVCFSAQDWWYHNRAHSDFQLMRQVAGQRRVLVVNSIGMRMPVPGRSTHVLRRIFRKLRSVAKFVRRPFPGFYVMSPLPLPLYGSRLGRRLGAALVRAQVRVVCLALGLRRPVIVATLPTAWDVVRPMRRRCLVYNRSDHHSAFPESGGTSIADMERALLERADHVVYVSNTLMAQERPITGERAYFLDHGVDLDHFTRVPPRAPARGPAGRTGSADRLLRRARRLRGRLRSAGSAGRRAARGVFGADRRRQRADRAAHPASERVLARLPPL
ncbi:hypothetical protein GCM10018955_31290 [Planomonospora venezuelensis]